MQSAQDWATENVPGAFDGAKDRLCVPKNLNPDVVMVKPAEDRV
jgi:hypothetical protein